MHDHQELTERTRELASVREPFEAVAAAEGTATMFALHGGKETQVLIPTLASAEYVSMAALLQSMRQGLGELGRLPAGRATGVTERTHQTIVSRPGTTETIAAALACTRGRVSAGSQAR